MKILLSSLIYIYIYICVYTSVHRTIRFVRSFNLQSVYSCYFFVVWLRQNGQSWFMECSTNEFNTQHTQNRTNIQLAAAVCWIYCQTECKKQFITSIQTERRRGNEVIVCTRLCVRWVSWVLSFMCVAEHSFGERKREYTYHLLSHWFQCCNSCGWFSNFLCTILPATCM